MSRAIDVERFSSLIQTVYDMIMLHEIEIIPKGLMKNLTFHEIHAIETVGDHPGSSMGELGRLSGVAPSTISVMIDKLVRRGFVRRRRSSSDRRVTVVSLTEKGKRAYEEHRGLHAKVGEILLSLMDEDEQRVIFGIYEKISGLIGDEAT